MSLINYINTVTDNTKVKNDIYTVTINNLPINIDKRGNKVIPPFTQVNDSSLVPKIEA